MPRVESWIGRTAFTWNGSTAFFLGNGGVDLSVEAARQHPLALAHERIADPAHRSAANLDFPLFAPRQARCWWYRHTRPACGRWRLIECGMDSVRPWSGGLDDWSLPNGVPYRRSSLPGIGLASGSDQRSNQVRALDAFGRRHQDRKRVGSSGPIARPKYRNYPRYSCHLGVAAELAGAPWFINVGESPILTRLERLTCPKKKQTGIIGLAPPGSYQPCRIHSSRSRDDRTRSVYSQSCPLSLATSRR